MRSLLEVNEAWSGGRSQFLTYSNGLRCYIIVDAAGLIDLATTY